MFWPMAAAGGAFVQCGRTRRAIRREKEISITDDTDDTDEGEIIIDANGTFHKPPNWA